MIKSFKITNHRSESIYLDIRKPEDTGFLVSSVEGIAYPKVEISTSDFSSYDGSSIGSMRVEERTIVFTLIFYEDNKMKYSVEELRHLCYKYFPLKKEITIEIENDSGIYKISGYVETSEIEIFTNMEGAQITIICPDPYFVSSESKILYMYESIPMFEFPVIFEPTVEFSKLDKTHKHEIWYDGTGERGITINASFTGNVGDFYVYDEISNGYIKVVSELVTQKLGSGLVINTRKGEKSAELIRDGVHHNILHCIDISSEWITFHQGLNIISYVATSGISNVKLFIEYETNCLGV